MQSRSAVKLFQTFKTRSLKKDHRRCHSKRFETLYNHGRSRSVGHRAKLIGVMAFPDFAFRDDLPSFFGHKEVRSYLSNYAEHFDILPFIKFGYVVENVRPLKGDDESKNVQWHLDVQELKTGCVTSHVFDAVIVCNGHYFEPRLPDAVHVKNFNGLVLHSHDYRHPEAFKDRSVVVLGAGPSGTDIAIEISPFVKKVCLCHEKAPFPAASLPENVKQKVGIDRMTSDAAILRNGERVEADTLILCTGYRFAFPFLSDECRPAILHDGRTVDGLYLHLIHSAFPTMSFIGIPKQVCPFPLFDRQVRFVLATLDGSVSLPSTSDMLEDVRREVEASAAAGKPAHHFHVFGEFQWVYNARLAEMAGFPPLLPVIKNLYEAVCPERVNSLIGYRSQSFKILDQQNFQKI